MQQAASRTTNAAKQKIKSFTDLHAWQEGHHLAIAVYHITKTFPRDEQFGLTSQLRRAVVSVTSNLAEGFGRKSEKEKIQFYTTAQSSVSEVQNQLLVARDVAYLQSDKFQELAQQSIRTHKLIGGLIRRIKNDIETA